MEALDAAAASASATVEAAEEAVRALVEEAKQGDELSADCLPPAGYRPNDVFVYKWPCVSLEVVQAVAVYAVPTDRVPSEGWEEPQGLLMSMCERFHHRQFLGKSALRWMLHGPVVLPHDTAHYRAHGHHHALPDGYWHSLKDDVMDVIFRDELPPAAKQSEEAPMSPPSMLAVVLFVDWGREDVGSPEELGKYYVGMNNTENQDLGDIKAMGGSAATYLGEFMSVGGMPEVGPDRAVAGVPAPEHGVHPMGFGVGIVTEEAWRHPTIPGSAIVTYHEGLGHALAMPHPPRRHPHGVMSMGMYSHLTLDDPAIHLGQDILRHMFANPALVPPCCEPPTGGLPPHIDDACTPDDLTAPVTVPAVSVDAAPSMVVFGSASLAWVYGDDASEHGCVARVVRNGSVRWVEGKVPAAPPGRVLNVYTSFKEAGFEAAGGDSTTALGAVPEPTPAPAPIGDVAPPVDEAAAGALPPALGDRPEFQAVLFDPYRKCYVHLGASVGLFCDPGSCGLEAAALEAALAGDASVLPPLPAWIPFTTSGRWVLHQ